MRNGPHHRRARLKGRHERGRSRCYFLQCACGTLFSDEGAHMIVVVLNDGETYTTIEGVRVLRVPETVEDADLDQWVKDAYLNAEDVN
ncbi:MAG: hypothetical protein ACK56F_27495, partial [bacterium]